MHCDFLVFAILSGEIGQSMFHKVSAHNDQNPNKKSKLGIVVFDNLWQGKPVASRNQPVPVRRLLSSSSWSAVQTCPGFSVVARKLSSSWSAVCQCWSVGKLCTSRRFANSLAQKYRKQTILFGEERIMKIWQHLVIWNSWFRKVSSWVMMIKYCGLLLSHFHFSVWNSELGQVLQNIQFSLTSRATGTFALILSEQSDKLISFKYISACEQWCSPKQSCCLSFSQPQVEEKVQLPITSCLNSRLPNH